MGWYYDYKPTIETDEGIKAKSKRGDFVKNWWATRWIKAMEQVIQSARLQRGRRYARMGQVLSLKMGKGTVTAKVQGSRSKPYRVEIALEPLADAEWEKVIDALAARPYFVAQLLAGEMPPEIEEVFAAVQLDLFPKRRALQQKCNCPDWVEVCKHLAAVHYILGERLDEDPFLLFQLRGRSRDALLTAMGSLAGPVETIETPSYTPEPSLAEELDSFWQAGPELDTVTVNIEVPESPHPLLERLGEPDFLPSARRWLAKAYDRVTERAMTVAYELDSEEGED